MEDAEAGAQQNVSDRQRNETRGKTQEHEEDAHDGDDADGERAAADERCAVEQEPHRGQRCELTTVEVHNAEGTKADPIQNFFLERYGAAYANELNTFIAAVESGNRNPKPSGFDGLQAQKLADAATVSWQTGKPVKVS